MQVTSRGLIRVFIWLISLGGFFYQTGTMLRIYFEYPFSVSVVEKLHKGIMFPAVTICLENWIDRSAYCSLDEHADALPIEQVNESKLQEMEYDFEAQKKISVSPADVFECSLSSTDPTCAAFTCTGNIRRTYFRHPKHMCYTLDPEQYQSSISRHGFSKCRSPWTWELSLIVHWITKHTIAINDTGKFPVIVHRPQTCPPDKLSSVVGDAGSSYVLSVTQQTVNRLPPPYESKCTDYVKEGRQPAFGGFMNQDTCLQKCHMTLEVKHCGCADPRHEFASSFGTKLCVVEEAEKCVSRLLQNRTFKNCEVRCRAPCRETTYDVRMTGMGVANVRECRLFGLKIKFASDSQKIFLYQPNLTASIRSIVEAFGYLGGYLGMWLGFSLLSILKSLQRKLFDFLSSTATVRRIVAPKYVISILLS
ncbi:unnamed protein product [Ixodes hexagonus]